MGRKALSPEQLLINKRQQKKEWKLRNAEKVKEYDKKYMDVYNKEYYLNNSERIKENVKIYCETDEGRKNRLKRSWKKQGILSDDYDALYESYINTHKCELCDTPFKDSFDRNLDHCHISGLVRRICCRSCNSSLPSQN